MLEKKKWALPSLLMVFFVMFSFLHAGDDDQKEAIKKVIISAYQEGLSNTGDTEAAKKGFHPGFNIIGLGSNNSIWKFPIYSWVESTEAKKADGKYPPDEKVLFKFPLIDITGNAAVAKIDYFKGETLIYTDYLSLYKFKEGWRIVSKIFFEHPTDKK